MCSKMFYNFTALFHHYNSTHSGLSDIKMCLKDGFLFENLVGLQEHVKAHEMKAKLPRIKMEVEK
jgi:hypothetical protein